MYPLTVTFFIDPDDSLGTLEAVLAIARRGGLQLAALELHVRARLDLHAPDPDLLDLFLARLHRQIGVDAIASTTQGLSRMHVA
jgi:hypothetical protein